MNTEPALDMHKLATDYSHAKFVGLRRVIYPSVSTGLSTLFNMVRRWSRSPPSAAQPDDQKSAMNSTKELAESSQRCLAVLILGLVFGTTAPAAAPSNYAERMHARAVESFRQGRFPEAYGRFIDLANGGHPASARYALWMCEQGPALFGKDWDCAPHEVEDWARLASWPTPRVASALNRVSSQPVVRSRHP